METIKETKQIVIIGGGHIGTALASGLVRAGMSASSVVVSNQSAKNREAVSGAEIVFLAVKPAVVPEVLSDIKDLLAEKTLVSLAAIVTLSRLREMAGGAQIARVMPNIPIAVNEGVLGLYAEDMSAEKKTELTALLEKLGSVIEVANDAELDAVTIVSGCGPGIASYFIDSLAKGARSLGMKEGAAQETAVHTFTGTLAYLRESGKMANELMGEVATKGGVTEAILESMKTAGVQEKIAEALQAGKRKIEGLK